MRGWDCCQGRCSADFLLPVLMGCRGARGLLALLNAMPEQAGLAALSVREPASSAKTAPASCGAGCIPWVQLGTESSSNIPAQLNAYTTLGKRATDAEARTLTWSDPGAPTPRVHVTCAACADQGRRKDP